MAGRLTRSQHCLPGLDDPLQRIHPAWASCADWENCPTSLEALSLLFKGIQKGSQEKKQETLCLAEENMACYKFQAIFTDKDKFVSAGISIITPERATLSYVFEKCKRSTSPQLQLLFVPRQLFSSLLGPEVHPSALCSLAGASEVPVSARSSP